VDALVCRAGNVIVCMNQLWYVVSVSVRKKAFGEIEFGRALVGLGRKFILIS